MSTMTNEEVAKALDELFAYDHEDDPPPAELYERVERWLHEDTDRTDALLTEIVIKRLSDKTDSGYDVEDVAQFFQWLAEEMSYDLFEEKE